MKKLIIIYTIGLILLLFILLLIPLINYYITEADISSSKSIWVLLNEGVNEYALPALGFFSPIILVGSYFVINKLVLNPQWGSWSQAKAAERYEKKHGIDYSKFKYSYDDDDDDDDKKEN
jgi:hypothetical protein